MRRAFARGFTLLEVMVAVAILGLGLTAILSAQAGSFASSKYARSVSIATGLARCKMEEVEEKLRRDGFQELDENDAGPCCDDDDTSPMTCTWRIEKLELPEPKFGQLDLGGGLDLSTPSSEGTSGLPLPDTDGGAPDIADLMNTALGIIYPTMQTIYQTSTRRVTVTVMWKDGSREQTIELVQWVVNSSALAPAGSASGSSPLTSPTGTGTTPSPTGTGRGGGMSPFPTPRGGGMR
jgi:general secretion pathway protein I